MKKLLFALAAVTFLGAGCTPTAEPIDVGNAAEMADIIFVTSPEPLDTVASPLTVTGEARGTWYFEASFPYELIGEDGDVLASGAAQADGEWMTEDFVPFSFDMTFSASAQDATLVLHNDNPSGDPARALELRIPVIIE